MPPERWRLFSEKPWEGKHAGRGSYKHIKKASIILGLPMPLYFVGMTGFEPATTRPPDEYSNRTELHPVCGCKSRNCFWILQINFYFCAGITHILGKTCKSDLPRRYTCGIKPYCRPAKASATGPSSSMHWPEEKTCRKMCRTATTHSLW